MILIVAAHPADESIAASSLLFRRSCPWVVHVTDGAPRDLAEARAHGFESREEYAAARDAEARVALALAGVTASRRVELGIVDQEAPLRLAALANALCNLFDRLRPEVVVTHAYEGGHPDHDASSFATHAATALLRAQGKKPPDVVEMASYHRGRDGTLEAGVFLGDGGTGLIVNRLDAAERAQKQRVLARYRTQRARLRRPRLDEERFRAAPRYDFTRPPHEGTLWYEGFPWGMSGERFRDLVRYALLELGLRLATEPARGVAEAR